jgi:hypothetical protein
MKRRISTSSMRERIKARVSLTRMVDSSTDDAMRASDSDEEENIDELY